MTSLDSMRQAHVEEQVSRAMAQQAGPLHEAPRGASQWQVRQQFQKPRVVPSCVLNAECFAGVQGKGRNNASGGWAPHLCQQWANSSATAHI